MKSIVVQYSAISIHREKQPMMEIMHDAGQWSEDERGIEW
jgi:hypothetical protein